MGAACACHRATDVVVAANKKSAVAESEADSMVPISEEKESSNVKRMKEDNGTPTPHHPSMKGGHLAKFLFDTNGKAIVRSRPEDIHLLLVDEDQSSLDIIGAWLRAKKYIVTTCFSGDEAHEVLTAAMRSCVGVGEVVTDIDIILSDHTLQVPNGGVILDYVLGSQKLKHIPVILMSASATSQAAARTIRRGGTDFLNKPISRVHLIKTITTVLENVATKKTARILKGKGDKYKRLLAEERAKRGPTSATTAVGSSAKTGSLRHLPGAGGATASTPASMVALPGGVTPGSHLDKPTPTAGGSPQTRPGAAAGVPYERGHSVSSFNYGLRAGASGAEMSLISPSHSLSRAAFHAGHLRAAYMTVDGGPLSPVTVVKGHNAAGGLQSAFDLDDTSYKIPLGDVHILVVDDDITVRKQIKHWLLSCHFSVTLCNCGKQALDYLDRVRTFTDEQRRVRHLLQLQQHAQTNPANSAAAAAHQQRQAGHAAGGAGAGGSHQQHNEASVSKTITVGATNTAVSAGSGSPPNKPYLAAAGLPASWHGASANGSSTPAAAGTPPHAATNPSGFASTTSGTASTTSKATTATATATNSGTQQQTPRVAAQLGLPPAHTLVHVTPPASAGAPPGSAGGATRSLNSSAPGTAAAPSSVHTLGVDDDFHVHPVRIPSQHGDYIRVSSYHAGATDEPTAMSIANATAAAAAMNSIAGNAPPAFNQMSSQSLPPLLANGSMLSRDPSLLGSTNISSSASPPVFLTGSSSLAHTQSLSDSPAPTNPQAAAASASAGTSGMNSGGNSTATSPNHPMTQVAMQLNGVAGAGFAIAASAAASAAFGAGALSGRSDLASDRSDPPAAPNGMQNLSVNLPAVAAANSLRSPMSNLLAGASFRSTNTNPEHSTLVSPMNAAPSSTLMAGVSHSNLHANVNAFAGAGSSRDLIQQIGSNRSSNNTFVTPPGMEAGGGAGHGQLTAFSSQYKFPASTMASSDGPKQPYSQYPPLQTPTHLPPVQVASAATSTNASSVDVSVNRSTGTMPLSATSATSTFHSSSPDIAAALGNYKPGFISTSLTPTAAAGSPHAAVGPAHNSHYPPTHSGSANHNHASALPLTTANGVLIPPFLSKDSSSPSGSHSSGSDALASAALQPGSAGPATAVGGGPTSGGSGVNSASVSSRAAGPTSKQSNSSGTSSRGSTNTGPTVTNASPHKAGAAGHQSKSSAEAALLANALNDEKTSDTTASTPAAGAGPASSGGPGGATGNLRHRSPTNAAVAAAAAIAGGPITPANAITPGSRPGGGAGLLSPGSQSHSHSPQHPPITGPGGRIFYANEPSVSSVMSHHFPASVSPSANAVAGMRPGHHYTGSSVMGGGAGGAGTYSASATPAHNQHLSVAAAGAYGKHDTKDGNDPTTPSPLAGSAGGGPANASHSHTSTPGSNPVGLNTTGGGGVTVTEHAHGSGTTSAFGYNRSSMSIAGGTAERGSIRPKIPRIDLKTGEPINPTAMLSGISPTHLKELEDQMKRNAGSGQVNDLIGDADDDDLPAAGTADVSARGSKPTGLSSSPPPAAPLGLVSGGSLGATPRTGRKPPVVPPIAFKPGTTIPMGGSMVDIKHQPSAAAAGGSAPPAGGAPPNKREILKKVDLILCDLEMPDMNGRQVLEKIKADPKKENIPVILMSASKTEPTDATSSIVAGCEDFVVKPLDKDLLLRKVTTVLENINQKMHSTILHARAQKYKRLLEQTRKLKKDREEAAAANLALAASDRSARAAAKKERAKSVHAGDAPVKAAPSNSTGGGLRDGNDRRRRTGSARQASTSDADSPEMSADNTPKISQR